ncbi:hypothetical protein V6N13_132277 [Hibiscus sabdariffa]|uniref:Uncharacterized protein n=1 Tax=Hibiscus sabdariffa TaxID=183260 RepID=A0ABR2PVG0_9ROSI
MESTQQQEEEATTPRRREQRDPEKETRLDGHFCFRRSVGAFMVMQRETVKCQQQRGGILSITNPGDTARKPPEKRRTKLGNLFSTTNQRIPSLTNGAGEEPPQQADRLWQAAASRRHPRKTLAFV